MWCGVVCGRVVDGRGGCVRVRRAGPRRVKMGPGGLEALITLGAGDMRRSLNIIQVRCRVAGAGEGVRTAPSHSCLRLSLALVRVARARRGSHGSPLLALQGRRRARSRSVPVRLWIASPLHLPLTHCAGPVRRPSALACREVPACLPTCVRPLRVLQSCHLAFDEVDERAVYLCTGNPQPKDMEAVLHSLLNDPLDVAFTSACAPPVCRVGKARLGRRRRDAPGAALVALQSLLPRNAHWTAWGGGEAGRGRVRQGRGADYGPACHRRLPAAAACRRDQRHTDEQGRGAGGHCQGAAPVSEERGRLWGGRDAQQGALAISQQSASGAPSHHHARIEP